ncbi:MAG: dTDP-glucose 4,6-dehydratase, partial [Thermoplasmata archaeon]
MNLMVTGGLGFIGSNFINYWMREHPEDSILNVDKVTYAANYSNILNPENRNYRFVKADIADGKAMEDLSRGMDAIVNFAAESHVDNSISSPRQFLLSNYMGVFSLLESARKNDIRFHQVSTDEVFGSLPLDSIEIFNENSPYNPRNPYSATKAAADFLIRSYVNTYGIKATISNCSNNYGPNQHPEKLIPKTVLNALSGRNIPIYGNGEQIRDWIHVEDHCRAIDLILKHGRIGETYLVSARNERRNIDVVKTILDMLGASTNLIEYVTDRPGHDV